ncbi:hypothetical protein DF047_35495 [Burkholderia cenocepacia]|nr:hypothetical protein DF047_35495 [Burkholderia cenocepacia]
MANQLFIPARRNAVYAPIWYEIGALTLSTSECVYIQRMFRYLDIACIPTARCAGPGGLLDEPLNGLDQRHMDMTMRMVCRVAE